jgi:hypothetical protein
VVAKDRITSREVRGEGLQDESEVIDEFYGWEAEVAGTKRGRHRPSAKWADGLTS